MVSNKNRINAQNYLADSTYCHVCYISVNNESSTSTNSCGALFDSEIHPCDSSKHVSKAVSQGKQAKCIDKGQDSLEVKQGGYGQKE